MHVRTGYAAQAPLLSPSTAPATGSGRLPLPWLLALAAALSISALLPRPLAWVAALAAVIVLGVPHGALDGEVARPLLRPRFGRAWFPVFSIPYLGLSATVLLAWRLAPEATLAAFLAVSVWHFGEEDAGDGGWLERLARGGLPIAAPVLLHPGATWTVLAAVALLPSSAMPPGWLLAASAVWVVVTGAAVAVLVRGGRTQALLEMAALGSAFAVLPPLTAFAFYFVGFHAPRHMTALVSSPTVAPRVTTMRDAVRRAVPVTLLTLLLGALMWPLFPGAAPDRLLSLTLQGLAALTLPHLLLGALAARRGLDRQHRA